MLRQLLVSEPLTVERDLLHMHRVLVVDEMMSKDSESSGRPPKLPPTLILRKKTFLGDNPPQNLFSS
jgi:hypothetical protein